MYQGKTENRDVAAPGENREQRLRCIRGNREQRQMYQGKTENRDVGVPGENR